VEFVAHLVFELVRWRFVVIIGVIVAMVSLPWLPVVLLRGRERKGMGAGCGVAIGFLIGFPFIFGLVFFGTGIATRLVYHNGMPAEGLVTGAFDTNTMYNDRMVYGYNVLLKRADGTTVESSFRTDDFNVYPPKNETHYPGVGERFSARYLPNHPTEFVIVATDDSPFARSLRCGDLEQKVGEAESKMRFASNDPNYRRQYQAAVAAARRGGCPVVDVSEGRQD